MLGREALELKEARKRGFDPNPVGAKVNDDKPCGLIDFADSAKTITVMAYLIVDGINLNRRDRPCLEGTGGKGAPGPGRSVHHLKYAPAIRLGPNPMGSSWTGGEDIAKLLHQDLHQIFGRLGGVFP